MNILALIVAPLLAQASTAEPLFLIGFPKADGALPGWRFFCENPDTPIGEVWTVAAKDGHRVLHCKGTPLGYLATIDDYTSFTLSLQWRWPSGKPGKGGVLLRMTGSDKIWPKSLEAQINAGDAGDFWGLDGYTLSGPKSRFKTLSHPQFGSLSNVKKAAALEKPAGQWNQYEIAANGETVILTINGQEVNRATACAITPGKICLTAEGSEIEFRDIRLAPQGGGAAH